MRHFCVIGDPSFNYTGDLRRPANFPSESNLARPGVSPDRCAFRAPGALFRACSQVAAAALGNGGALTTARRISVGFADHSGSICEAGFPRNAAGGVAVRACCVAQDTLRDLSTDVLSLSGTQQAGTAEMHGDDACETRYACPGCTHAWRGSGSPLHATVQGLQNSLDAYGSRQHSFT